jgi:hypothetical protein
MTNHGLTKNADGSFDLVKIIMTKDKDGKSMFEITMPPACGKHLSAKGKKYLKLFTDELDQSIADFAKEMAEEIADFAKDIQKKTMN